jgi:hypothetical protein
LRKTLLTVYDEHMTSPEMAGAESPIDFEHFLDTYVLGPQELDSTIAFGAHTGSVAAMLGDEGCPVGGILAEAYKSDGISGVESKLEGLSTFSSGGFSLPISEQTRSFHEGTTDRDTLLRQPSGESPDFLA